MKTIQNYTFPLLIGACLSFPCMAAELDKDREFLEEELKPLVLDAITLHGIQGMNEERVGKVADYVNENLSSLYKEIDYFDEAVVKWQEEVRGEDPSLIYEIFDDEEGYHAKTDSLMCFVSRRDDAYFDVMNNLADNLDIKDASKIRKLIRLADPDFFRVNARQVKVQALGEKLDQAGKGDEVFKALMDAWFPEIDHQDRIWRSGNPVRMPRSGIRGARYAPEGPVAAMRSQKQKINSFNEQWNRVMYKLRDAKTQADLDACTKELESLAYPLIELQTLLPPENDGLEEELRKLYFEKVYMPLSLINADLYDGENAYIKATMEESYNKGVISDILDGLSKNKDVNLDAFNERWETLFKCAKGCDREDQPSYLREYAVETAFKIISEQFL